MKKKLWLLLFTCLQIVFSGHAQDLRQSFKIPPQTAKPRVWWHWMNGNITKEGIRKDLLWMKEAGIGGFQNFDAGMATRQVVDKKLSYMTPDWKDAFGYATYLADSLGLEMAIAGSPGWSESGGPWVKNKDGMKKIVWSEMVVNENSIGKITLPRPPANFGEFQSIPPPPAFGTGKPTVAPREYYEDIAVIAYRLPAEFASMMELNPKVTTSGGDFDLQQLCDGDILKTNRLLVNPNQESSWIQFEFSVPQTVKAVKIVGGGTRTIWGVPAASEERSLQVSDDGVKFRHIMYLPLGTVEQQTFGFPKVSAKFFRVVFKNPKPQKLYGNVYTKAANKIDIAELELIPQPRVNHVEDKAGFGISVDLSKYPTPENAEGIDINDILNLTGKLDYESGELDWIASDGNWKIVRYGYSTTGKLNHPASPEATGLEVDKMDARAVKDYFENYLDQYKSASGGLMGKKGLQYVVTDSYEAGQANWTPNMPAEFEKRRGYGIWNWLPVISGAVIKDAASSDKFLWDFRKTISELIAENHYDQLTEILARRDMKRYSESHENGRVFVADGMEVKRSAAVPMSAMWVAGGTPKDMYEADIRESASVAHIYGQNIAAAESFTASGAAGVGPAWGYAPENLKSTADLEMANGLNRFVVHTSVHQPVDKVPGLGLAHFGQWFTRHETWADQASAWTDYLSRSCYMLQQGKFVADVVYYYGEDSNITFLFGDKLPPVPQGYNFDFINADALVNLLETNKNMLTTPSGMKYRVMVLDSNSRAMTLRVLKKIQKLVQGGATIIGPKPSGSPSLMDDKKEYDLIVKELWDSGKIDSKIAIQGILTKLKVLPAFQYSKPNKDTDLKYVQRTLPEGEVFWVSNANNRYENVSAQFRVSGKEPEIWRPETGTVEKVSYSIKNGITTIPLKLSPEDAVFVVFVKNTSKSSAVIADKKVVGEVPIEGDWQISFQKGRGAPDKVTFSKLTSFHENENKGIRYFSGTAAYWKKITISKIEKGAYILDLGEVKNLAEVIVNGKNLGIVWKKPFRTDISNALITGENIIEIKVTNLWVNRLIGDRQPDVADKITFTAQPFYKADSPLMPSGLLGPVKLELLK
jgi:hypothetical protein